MQSFRNLIDDPRFAHVSTETKTDIINSIGFDLRNTAAEPCLESKVTQDDMVNSLRYLLARESRENQNVRRLLRAAETDEAESSYRLNPFVFGSNDPLLNYWMWNSIGHSISHSNGCGSGGGCGNCGGGKGEGMCIACALVVACFACFCCGAVANCTLESRESKAVQGSKILGSSIIGGIVFLGLMIYFINNKVLSNELVVDSNWSEGGYKFFMFLLAAIAGTLSAGTTLLISNCIPCVPKEPELPSLTEAMQIALHQLQPIQRLLTEGWIRREGDDTTECDAFVREAINTYLQVLQYHRAEFVAVNISNAPPRSVMFVPPPAYGVANLAAPSASYIRLEDGKDDRFSVSKTGKTP